MRASEFITENSNGKLSKRAEQATQATIKMRDVGGYDRVYHLNRIWMAMACADGEDTNAIKGVDASSWAEKFNTAHPYTEKEYNMIMQAMATVPSEQQEVVPWSKSLEPESTNTKSLVVPFKGYKKK